MVKLFKHGVQMYYINDAAFLIVSLKDTHFYK